MRWTRLLLAVPVLVVATLLSGCVVWRSSETHQVKTIGAVETTFTACASGSSGCDDLGFSQIQAFPGTGQILDRGAGPGARQPARHLRLDGPGAPDLLPEPELYLRAAAARAPPRLTLGRLHLGDHKLRARERPPGPVGLARPGARAGRGRQPLRRRARRRPGDRRAPGDGRLPGHSAGGLRTSLTTLFDEDPAEPTVAAVICKDDAFDFSVATRDLCILAGEASAGARPGPSPSSRSPFATRGWREAPRRSTGCRRRAR